jgi:hypothetical protein
VQLLPCGARGTAPPDDGSRREVISIVNFIIGGATPTRSPRVRNTYQSDGNLGGADTYQSDGNCDTERIGSSDGNLDFVRTDGQVIRPALFIITVDRDITTVKRTVSKQASGSKYGKAKR